MQANDRFPSAGFSALPAWLAVSIVVVSLAGPAVVLEVVWPAWFEAEEMPAVDAALSFTAYVLMAVFLFLAVCAKGIRAEVQLGPRPSRSGSLKYMAVAIPLIGISMLGLYILYVPLSFIWPDFVYLWVLDYPPLIWSQGNIWAILTNITNFITIVVLAPVLEELLFRGFSLNRLASRYGSVKGIILSSILLAVIHIEIIGGIIFSVVLCIVYMRSHSLFGPIIIHSANNLFLMVASVVEIGLLGSEATWTLAEFQSYWWLAVIGGTVGVPWLILFWRRTAGNIISPASKAAVGGTELDR